MKRIFWFLVLIIVVAASISLVACSSKSNDDVEQDDLQDTVIQQTYTIIWKNWDGTILETDKNVRNGTTPTYDGQTPIREEDDTCIYTFRGWSPEIKEVSRNQIYIAQFYSQNKAYTISFNLNGGSTTSNTEPKDITSLDPNNFFFNVSKSQYNFRGWSYKGTRVFDQNGNLLNNILLEQNMVFDAVFVQGVTLTIYYSLYEPRTETLVNTFNSLDSSIGSGSKTQDYDYNTNVNLTMSLNEGYEFVGWYYNEYPLSTETSYNYMMWDEDITIEAIIKYKTYDLEVFSNNYDLGQVIVRKLNNNIYCNNDSESKYYTESATIAALTKGDARFLGWYNENNELVTTKAVYSFIMPQNNYILEAKWDYFRINYNIDGGINDSRNPSSYTSESGIINLYNPTKNGHIFDGWYQNGIKITTINSNQKKHLEIKAKWLMEILWKNYDGTILETDTNIEYGSIPIYNGDNPTRPSDNTYDYSFAGWDKEITPATESTIYTAIYTPTYINYTIIFKNYDNSIISSNTYHYGDTVIVPNNPTRPSDDTYVYSFVGWDKNVCIVVGNAEYLAIYEEKDKGYIKYLKYKTSNNTATITNYTGTIMDIVIPEELYDDLGNSFIVTGIDSGAFSHKDLTNVVLPNTLLTIGDEAFSWCRKLKNISLSQNLTHIGKEAFSWCQKLIKIIIPDSVIDIGDDAFYNCYSLTSITLGSSVSNIGRDVCFGCNKVVEIYNRSPISITSQSLRTIGIYGKYGLDIYSSTGYVSKITTINNMVLYQKDDETCYLLVYGGDAQEIIIPNIVTHITKDTFSRCVELTSVIIPDSVTTIESGAFGGCSNMESIVLSNNITSIEFYTFGWCSSLKSITFPENLVSIGDNAFIGCSSLTSLHLPRYVSEILFAAFDCCSGLTNITVDVNNTTFDSRDNCNAIIETKTNKLVVGCENTIIPNSIKIIGDGAFTYRTGLTSITIPDGVVEIGPMVFSECYNLNNITIPSGVNKIDSQAFQYCTSLTSINIPRSIRAMGCNVFANCTALASVVIEDGALVLGDGIFENCTALTSIEIPSSVVELGYSAFGGCTNLTSVIIHDTIEIVGQGAFDGCNSLVFNTYQNGIYLGNEQNPYVALYSIIDNSIEELTIHENTTTICSGICERYTNLVSVTLPSNLKHIGNQAFYGCTSLINISIPDGLESIGSYAFYGCTNLANISIPNSLKSIGVCAFDNCDSIIYSTYGNGKYLGNTTNPYLLLYSVVDSTLQDISINENTEMLSGELFYVCISAESIIIPSNIRFIGSMTFNYAYQITSVTILNNNIIIENGFIYNSSISNVYFNGTTEEWYNILIYNDVDYGYITYVIHCIDGDIQIEKTRD